MNMNGLKKWLIYAFVAFLFIGCSVFGKPKEGCPSNGKNIGAERILTGEKVPKAKKFRN
jgi:hypothetical protein